ncbi:hypothetical protein BMW22_15810 [Rhizobium leguminosarum]|uniref:Transmembrane protein n=1 Tax=Rhizobium leguminosarum TaxID=384 RepID=A0A1L3ZBE7_RHILE|nr:hypothetical protein [Rhizobium leguminosarum]API52891.1 hypothetical protein BMW22_15810 [Rhizobium leguminosarum]
MTYAQYAIAFIILIPIAAIVIGNLLKSHLDRHYPNCDNEGEIESFLASGLEAELSTEAA